MDATLSVGEVSAILQVRPRTITQLFYQYPDRWRECAIVNGRRRIPQSSVASIASELRRRGYRVGGVS